MNKTVIIGGGIAGLATAFYLQESGSLDFTLIECSPRLGGKITSVDQDGFLVEGGPDSFITQKAAALDLCTRLGLAGELVGSNTGKSATTYIWSGGRLHPMPEGMMLMAHTMDSPLSFAHASSLGPASCAWVWNRSSPKHPATTMKVSPHLSADA